MLKACYKLFQATLTDIRDKIDPVLKSTMYTKEEVSRKDKDQNDKERKHDEGKSRWEKNCKESIKDEPMELDSIELSDDKRQVKSE